MKSRFASCWFRQTTARFPSGRCALAVLALVLFTGWGGSAASPSSGEGDDLFAGDRVFEIDISIPQSGIANLRTYHWRRWRGTGLPKPKALATIVSGGVTYTNVSVQLKGSAGSFRSIDDTPALTLNFDKHVEDQVFHGYDKFYLNNSLQDRSYVNEKICRELYNAAGIPTPRATHAWVTLNGRTLGLYVLIEGFNKKFLRRHFENVSGNLYDGGFAQDIHGNLTVNSGDNPDDKSDLKALYRVAVERNIRKRFQLLPRMLDMERFYTLMALDIMTWNWDGYTMKPNNFRLFHDMKSDRFIFIPHGMDQMFDEPNGSIFPRVRGVVARSILELPAARVQLFDRMNSLLGSVFDENKLTRRIQEITSSLQTFLREKDSYRARRQQTEALRLQVQVGGRASHIRKHLGVGAQTPQFGADGTVRLQQWVPRGQFGQPRLSRGRQGSRELLQITASGSEEIAIGNWSTSVWLKQGRYRFSGMMQAANIRVMARDTRGGAGLRATGSGRPARVQGTRGWQPIAVDFSVDLPAKEIQLVCELRAASGSVAFDANSLRLTKLP